MDKDRLLALREKRAQLMQKRDTLLKGLRQRGDWPELHAVCSEIAKADDALSAARRGVADRSPGVPALIVPLGSITGMSKGE